MNALLAQDELVFSNVDSLWWAAPVFVAILGLVIYLYALERRLTKRWVGFTLMGVRAALVTVLCLMFLEPIVASQFTVVHPTTIAVLVDDSLSMDVANDPLSDGERLRIAESLGLLPAGVRRVRLERRADLLASDTETLADLSVALETLRRQVAESTLSQRQLTGRLGRLRGMTADLRGAVKTARDALAGLLAANLDAGATGELRVADERLSAGAGALLSKLAVVLEDAAGKKPEQLRESDVAHWIDSCRDAAAARDRAVAAVRRAGELADEQIVRSGAPAVRDAVAAVANLSRGQMAERLISSGGILEKLKADGYRVALYRFNKTAGKLTLDGRGAETQPAGNRAFTDMAAGLSKVAADAAGQRLGAVLMLTDGQHNRPDSARRAAAVLGAPIYPIALGSDRRPKDVAVAAVIADTSYAKDIAEVYAKIKTDGLRAGMPLRVNLIEGEKLIDSQPLIVGAEGELATVRFLFPAGDVVAQRRLAVSIDPLPGEAFTENNAKPFTLHVTDKKIRVLMIDGPPRWCFQYIRNVLKRDKKIELTPILLEPALISLVGGELDHAPARKQIAELVGKKEKLLTFDVVVFGDVDPEKLTPEEMTNLHDFVLNRGGTLILIAGKQHLPAAYLNTPLKDLIAVRLPESIEPEPAGSDKPPTVEPFHIRMTAEGLAHDVCRLEAEDPANRKAWDRMPRFLWRSRFCHAGENATVLAYAEPLGDGAVGARPVSTGNLSLADHQKQNAVMLSARYGLGKVLYLATDRMWRFRYRRGDKYHHRFWGQVLRWATAEKLNLQLKHFGLGSDKIVYDEGSPIPVTARVLAEEMIPLAGGIVRAELTAEGKIIARTLLIHQPDSGGLYQGTFARVPAGTYRLRLDVPPELEDLLAAETDGAGLSLPLEVRDQPSAERIELATNTALLAELAATSGGRVFRMDNARGVLDALPAARWESPPQYRGMRLWDSWIVLAIFVGLITMEWILRKRVGLI